MNYSVGAGWSAMAITISMFGVLCLITFLAFIYSEKIMGVLGKSGLDIVTRLMGLILAVIGTQMLIEGVLGVVGSYTS